MQTYDDSEDTPPIHGLIDGIRHPLAHGLVSSGHGVSAPHEIATCPIELNESIQKKISRRHTSLAPHGSLTKLNGHSLSPGMMTPCLEEDNQGSCKGSMLLPIDALPRVAVRNDNTTDCTKNDYDSTMPPLMPIPALKSFIHALDVNYQRVAISGEQVSGVALEDLRTASEYLIEALRIRQKYMKRSLQRFTTTASKFLSHEYPANLTTGKLKTELLSTENLAYHEPEDFEKNPFENPSLPALNYVLKSVQGIIHILGPDGQLIPEVRDHYTTLPEFMSDFQFLYDMMADGPLKSFCYRRLCYLLHKYQLHVLLNEVRELAEQKAVSHRDFYNVRKVDTHVHAASCMNHKHLLRFIKKKMKTDANTVVCVENGQELTLEQVFKKLDITSYDLNIDMLDVHADRNTFHRFDKFNSKYNPMGENMLRDIFIKTDNRIKGKFFADVLKEVISDLEESKYQYAEYRLSIYGKSRGEWDALANWAVENHVHSRSVRWLIQIPRLYDIYKANKVCSNFQEVLDNIFLPLFEVTNDPNSHPALHQFLFYICGMDSVDDESKPETVTFDNRVPTADCWDNAENPPYGYYLFYMYANISVLNHFRKARGLNTFVFRPHCGEAGLIYHIVVGFMVAESISHGLLLRKAPVVQYLYYLCNIGVAMSPLSNNGLFLAYQRSPVAEFISKGLNVSLSTDDPLQFHYTKEPLIEEYSIAAQTWKFHASDMCEVAKNSVLQSGFPKTMKNHWLGTNHEEEGVLGNDTRRTNVPDIRVCFRYETLIDELCTVFYPINLDQDQQALQNQTEKLVTCFKEN